jgi:hypothetical protein
LVLWKVWNHGIWLDFPETVGNGIIIPTDFHSIIFQRGRLKPPTSHFEFDRLSETWNDAAFLKSPVGNLN